MSKFFIRIIVLVICTSSVAASIVGCGSGTSTPEPLATKAEVNNIVEMRKYFDKAGGDWNKLSAEDQAAYTKLAGDSTKAQAMWNNMASPTGSGASSGQR